MQCSNFVVDPVGAAKHGGFQMERWTRFLSIE
jgi:hypothetical protein